MYRVKKVQISEKNCLYDYLLNISKLSNNLYNATLFRVRQLMTSRDKEILSDNEIQVLHEVEIMNQNLIERKKNPRVINNSGCVSYYFLEDLLKFNKNVDYLHEEIPCHTAQSVVKSVNQNMKAFFEATKEYKKDPSKFLGKPKLPKYKHKGGMSGFKFSNQECIIKQNKKGNYYAKLPYTKNIVCLGKNIEYPLKEVQVTYTNKVFLLCFVFSDDEVNLTFKSPENICAIDLGVNNLMAVTNNLGLPNILYDGRYLKSINHLYNKKIAKINSEGFSSSNRYSAITRKRNNQINDYISKVSKDLVNWCVEIRIDTVVVGLNKHWKDNSKMDNVNNQNFIQIPHTRLIFNLKYRLEQRGINLIETEEAYSSKASYLEKDPLPQYDPNLKIKFSGRRIKRGLYKSKEGVILNADLNGSANIMRKVFPDEIVSFDKVQIIKNVTSIRG